MDATTQSQAAIMQQFIDELVNKRFSGEEGVTEEVKKELQQDALERMQLFILDSTMAELSDQDVEEFSKMVEEKRSPEEIEQFVKIHITDYPVFMKDVLQEFEEIYLKG